MELLEDLPLGFVKDYDYGLGLVSTYNSIIHAVEQLTDCTEIYIADDTRITGETGGDSFTFHISIAEFEALRKSINKTARISQVAARAVKDGTTYNFFRCQNLDNQANQFRMGGASSESK